MEPPIKTSISPCSFSEAVIKATKPSSHQGPTFYWLKGTIPFHPPTSLRLWAMVVLFPPGPCVWLVAIWTKTSGCSWKDPWRSWITPWLRRKKWWVGGVGTSYCWEKHEKNPGFIGRSKSSHENMFGMGISTWGIEDKNPTILEKMRGVCWDSPKNGEFTRWDVPDLSCWRKLASYPPVIKHG